MSHARIFLHAAIIKDVLQAIADSQQFPISQSLQDQLHILANQLEEDLADPMHVILLILIYKDSKSSIAKTRLQTLWLSLFKHEIFLKGMPADLLGKFLQAIVDKGAELKALLPYIDKNALLRWRNNLLGIVETNYLDTDMRTAQINALLQAICVETFIGNLLKRDTTFTFKWLKAKWKPTDVLKASQTTVELLQGEVLSPACSSKKYPEIYYRLEPRIVFPVPFYRDISIAPSQLAQEDISTSVFHTSLEWLSMGLDLLFANQIDKAYRAFKMAILQDIEVAQQFFEDRLIDFFAQSDSVCASKDVAVDIGLIYLLFHGRALYFRSIQKTGQASEAGLQQALTHLTLACEPDPHNILNQIEANIVSGYLEIELKHDADAFKHFLDAKNLLAKQYFLLDVESLRDVHLALANAFRTLDCMGFAAEHYTHAIYFSKPAVKLYVARAELYLNVKQYEQAVEDIEKAAARDPDFVFNRYASPCNNVQYFARGLAAMRLQHQQDKADGALEVLVNEFFNSNAQAVTPLPVVAKAILYLSDYYREQRQFELAKILLDRAIAVPQLQPYHEEFKFHRGIILLLLGSVRQAISDLPASNQKLENQCVLAIVYLQLGIVEEARNVLLRLRKTYADHFMVNALYAVLYEINEHPSAVKLIESMPNYQQHPELQIVRGRIALLQNDIRFAEQQFRMARSMRGVSEAASLYCAIQLVKLATHHASIDGTQASLQAAKSALAVALQTFTEKYVGKMTVEEKILRVFALLAIGGHEAMEGLAELRLLLKQHTYEDVPFDLRREFLEILLKHMREVGYPAALQPLLAVNTYDGNTLRTLKQQVGAAVKLVTNPVISHVPAGFSAVLSMFGRQLDSNTSIQPRNNLANTR